MKEEYQLKLKDFFSNIVKLGDSDYLPMGAIIISPDDRAEALSFVPAEGVGVIKVEEQSSDAILKEMVGNLKENKGVVCDISKSLDIQTRNHLLLMADNQLKTTFAGDTEETFLSPLSDGGFVLFLMDEELYKSTKWGDTLTNFCNLTE